MRSKKVEEAIKRVKRELTDEDKREYMSSWFAEDLDTALSYIEELEKNNKDYDLIMNRQYEHIKNSVDKQVIRDKIKELEEDKQTILQAIEEAKESKDEEFLKYNREILYRINGEISVLKEIIGE